MKVPFVYQDVPLLVTESLSGMCTVCLIVSLSFFLKNFKHGKGALNDLKMGFFQALMQI